MLFYRVLFSTTHPELLTNLLIDENVNESASCCNTTLFSDQLFECEALDRLLDVGFASIENLSSEPNKSRVWYHLLID